jgi:Zn-dependent protease
VGNRLTIGSVAGIEIRIHRSWIFIALLIAWSFWSRFTLTGYGTGLAVGMAVVGAILFFVSVLVHELAHSLEAQHRGVEVDGITLFLFGGATETRFDVKRPRDEFALTAVGPFSSFVLAALFGLLAFYSAGAGLEVVAEVAGLLGYVNLALGVFNLLPGAPLDGGRILRSAVWAVTGDRRRAIRIAARTGQVIGYLIATLGLFQLFFVAGGLIGGLWFMFIGWFLAMAAQSEVVQHEVQERLRGLTMGELLYDRALPSVEADLDLASASERLRHQSEDALAVTQGDRTTGVLASELAAIVSEGAPGQEVALTVLREGDERTETIELAPLGEGAQPGQIGIGVLAATVDLEIDAPVEARPTEDARIGGPSAGLMLALGTYAAASGVELADGRTIAGSGTIDLSGNVGPVEGITAKVRGAEQAGSEVFVVAEALADEASEVAPDGLEVVGVGSLQEAIDQLI